MGVSDITVSGLTAIDDVKGIKLSWVVTDPRNGALPNIALDAVEIWASATNDRAAAAVKVGEGIRDFLHAGLNRGDVRYYWAKARNKIGSYGPWYPAGATAGVQGTEASGDVLIATNGFWKHPSGLIEQWGRDDLAVGGSSTEITFPEAFPTQCFQVIASPLLVAVATLITTIEIESFTTLKVKLMPKQYNSLGGPLPPVTTALWRALGY